jgi:hypothetical protein
LHRRVRLSSCSTSNIRRTFASFYAIIPLCAPFDGDPPERTQEEQREMAKECALLIPAYKAATIVPETIEAALKVFPPEVSNHSATLLMH